jgi:hypothetical protein
MKTPLLLPYPTRKWGSAFVILALLFALVWQLEWFDLSFLDHVPMLALYQDNFLGDDPKGFFKIVNKEIRMDIIGFLMILGLIGIAFSKEKDEDEFIQNMRASALQDSVLIFYLLFLISIACIHGMFFLSILTYNTVALLLLFILLFSYRKYKASKI